jgi:dTDP-4-dehydrorhamnose reductase
MRVAVLGANGQLGSELAGELGRRGATVCALDHAAIRIEELDSVRAALHPLAPDLILDTAAFHHLPRCEEDPARAFAVNATGAANVAQVAAELGARNVYFSTDYVFDGEKGAPYRESDPPRPQSVYAASKLAGEAATLAGAAGYVVRVSGLYGAVPCRAKGESFVHKMLRLARELPEVRVVDDEILTPTPTRAIAEHLPTLLAQGEPGLYHLTCEGACSWYELAHEIFARAALTTPLVRARSADFPSTVRRPRYSVLENARFNALGAARMPTWREGLHAFLATLPGAAPGAASVAAPGPDGPVPSITA